MKTALAAAACLVLGLAAGLGGGLLLGRATAPAAGPGAPPAPAAAPRSNFPTAAEVTEYLDGKDIALSPPDAPRGPLTHTMRKGQIEAVQFGNSAGSVNDAPWETRVTFLLDTGHGRYVVDGQIQYRIVGDKCAFFGFNPETTARQ